MKIFLDTSKQRNTYGGKKDMCLSEREREPERKPEIRISVRK
jgi:hypothetical protein